MFIWKKRVGKARPKKAQAREDRSGAINCRKNEGDQPIMIEHAFVRMLQNRSFDDCSRSPALPAYPKPFRHSASYLAHPTLSSDPPNEFPSVQGYIHGDAMTGFA